MSSLVNQTSACVAGGVVPNRMGNEHLSLYPYEPMATADGDLIIAVGNDRQFRRLAGGVPTVRNPLTLSATPARHDLAPPALDEHGAEIRAWLRSHG